MPEAALILRRVWRAEAEAAVAVAGAMPAAAGVEPLGDGALVALGAGRYVNRAIGVGPDLHDADLDRIERFYADRGLPPSVQITTWADETTLDRLTARGYRPQWFRSVFAAPLPLPDAPPTKVEIVEVDDGNMDDWLAVLADGNEIPTAEGRAVSDEFGQAAHRAAGSTDLLALLDGHPVGCGSLQVASGVALLGGAATLPGHRGRGVQGALLRHRLRLAADLGCTVAASTALPAGASARNIQRHGLALVDTQLVLTV